MIANSLRNQNAARGQRGRDVNVNGKNQTKPNDLHTADMESQAYKIKLKRTVVESETLNCVNMQQIVSSVYIFLNIKILLHLSSSILA